jgi:esterase/lipase
VASCAELKRENKDIGEELLEWKRNFKDLESESRKLCDEMLKELEKKDEIINDLSSANDELQSYIDCLMRSEGLTYKGKNIRCHKKIQNIKMFPTSCEDGTLVRRIFWP